MDKTKNGEKNEVTMNEETPKDAEKQKEMPVNKKSGWFMGCGAVTVLIGAITAGFWPAIFFSLLKRALVLTNTSISFGIWQEIPFPIYLELHLWNITNVDEILAGKNVSIKVHKMGPYVYREQFKRVDIEFNDNSTVTYYNEKFWHFQPELSNGSLSDMVTSINPVVATVAYLVRNQPAVLQVAADVLMRMYHDHMFTTANASDWLFDGINDSLLETVFTLPIQFSIPYDKFGWFYTRNGSKEFDGVFVVNTGAEDFSKFGQVELWNHSNRTIYRDECGEVRGSTGELWAPELGQPEVEMFLSDLCTYVVLMKNKTVEHEGIEGVEYNAGTTVFDNGWNDPRKACYCDKVRDRNCLPSGALNVSSCWFGAPAFVSLPHFLHTDPHYPSKIEGLEPKEEYNFRLVLEMLTGIPLAVTAQLQLNLLVRHIPGISIINALPDEDVLVPALLIRQEVRVTPEYEKLARMAINIRFITPYAFYTLTAIGVGLLVAGIVILVRRVLRSPDTTPILQNDAN